MGHRIYSNDALRTMEEAFGTGGDFIANQSDPERAALFLRENLEFPDRSFDGALIWDTLQFLAPPLLQDTVDRLYRILRPQSSLLAFFHAEEKAQTAPLYSYRIVESKIMSLTPRNQVRPVQYFNNRSLEKLFQKFQFGEVFPHPRSLAGSDRSPLNDRSLTVVPSSLEPARRRSTAARTSSPSSTAPNSCGRPAADC